MKPASNGATEDALTTGHASRTDGSAAGWTTAALLAVMWTGVPWAAPLGAAAPLVVGLRKNRFRLETSLVTRWVATVWVGAVVLIGLIGPRAVRTVPFGAAEVDHALGWLNGGGSAPPGVLTMLGASAGFVVAAAATRGVLGCVALAGIVLQTAVTAGVVFAHSTNVIEATVVALPVWTLLWVAGMTVILGPLSAWKFGSKPAVRPPRRALLVATALVAAAILLRLGAAPLYTDLAQRLTVR
jgi:hypothetical protein